MFFTVANINVYFKTAYCQYNLMILRHKVTKNIKNLRKKFCEFRPCNLAKYCTRQKKCTISISKLERKKIKGVHYLE